MRPSLLAPAVLKLHVDHTPRHSCMLQWHATPGAGRLCRSLLAVHTSHHCRPCHRYHELRQVTLLPLLLLPSQTSKGAHAHAHPQAHAAVHRLLLTPSSCRPVARPCPCTSLLRQLLLLRPRPVVCSHCRSAGRVREPRAHSKWMCMVETTAAMAEGCNTHAVLPGTSSPLSKDCRLRFTALDMLCCLVSNES